MQNCISRHSNHYWGIDNSQTEENYFLCLDFIPALFFKYWCFIYCSKGMALYWCFIYPALRAWQSITFITDVFHIVFPGYREDLFPEQSPSSMSSPSRSQFTSTHSSPQNSLHPDVMLVSRGDGRYEKLIDCEICGKMCRTSNMARHRKRYCLLSTSREEILESDSPGVQGLFSEYEEKAWSLNGSKE